MTLALVSTNNHLKLADCVVSLFAADRRAQFESLEYTEEDYQKELEHIEKVKHLHEFTFSYINVLPI